jgi:hypothetical protein
MKAAVREAFARLTSTLRDSDGNADAIGRILRAHLAIEVRLRHLIEVVNPNLGDLEPIGLNFDRLVKIYAGLRDYSFPWLVPGLKALNQVRNRFAHSLSAEITPEHLQPMTSLVATWQPPIDAAALGRHPHVACELFAMLAGLTLAWLEAAFLHTQQLDAELRRIFEEEARLTDEFLAGPSTVAKNDA